MLGTRPVDIWFERTISFQDENVKIEDKIKNLSKTPIFKLLFGDEFFVRYVLSLILPISRTKYFW